MRRWMRCYKGAPAPERIRDWSATGRVPGLAAAVLRRMPVPPWIIVALGTLGAAALAKLIAAETRKVNDRMDRQRAAEDGELKTIPLVRDPVTGDYRPRQP